VTSNLAETSIAKSQQSVPYGANLFRLVTDYVVSYCLTTSC